MIIVVYESKNGNGYYFDYKSVRVWIKKINFDNEHKNIEHYVGCAYSHSQEKANYSKPNRCLNSVVQEFINIIDERS